MDVDNTPTRVEDLWFPDGYLVVQAEQSLFRISGGILAARSSVFTDMLAFTQPPDAETIDGCPVVRLPDRAEDLTCFFRAIFDSSFFETYPTKVSFESVLSVLRCSDKYEVEYLRRRALVHLSYDFPTTLTALDAASAKESATNFREIWIESILASACVAVIQLARQVNALWLLPIAFYELATRDNATIQIVLHCSTSNNHPARLSGDDQILFLTSSMLIGHLEHEALGFLHSMENSAECSRGTRCEAARLKAIAKAHLLITMVTSPIPLGICSVPGVWGDLSKGCCVKCYNCLKEAHAIARQKIWDELPGICGLPPWPELEKMKADALKA
ncbi:hypothetical protein B0H14DRAFT_2522183 [Mycena olivaceomarginata]|nr:hypothetical protein B0H14DRAFT_2522183 [Mycena olivaceomarginata]